MGAPGRKCRTGGAKTGLDEENVGTHNELDDGLPIGLGVRNIGHVSELLAAGNGKDVPQLAKRHDINARVRRNFDGVIIVTFFGYGPLELPQPGADRKPAVPKPGFPNVNVYRLFDRKPKARDTMLKDCGGDLEIGRGL